MGKVLKLAFGAVAGLYALMQVLVLAGLADPNPQGMQGRTNASAGIGLAILAGLIAVLLLRSAIRRRPKPDPEAEADRAEMP